ncbi:MAG: dTDP-glucose 4,6-dehydratase, partial [Pseudomonadota bacterium]
MQTVLVTGGAGFIGGNFVHHWLERQGGKVVVLDKMTYAGNAQTIGAALQSGQCELVVGDIQDRELVRSLLQKHRPTALVHFAA